MIRFLAGRTDHPDMGKLNSLNCSTGELRMRFPLMAKRIRSKLLCFILIGVIILSFSGISSAQEAIPTGNDTEKPDSADQVTEPEKDFDAADYYARLLRCTEQIRERTDFVPDVALVPGSGLGNYAEQLNVVGTIPYSEIIGWPDTSVAGHSGNLVFATMNGLNIAIMQGRIHYYEGYDMQDVVLPLRVLHLLGAKMVILTNAVGAINESYAVGDFVVVEDHISFFVPSPLIGENIDELGNRFTGMTSVYDKELRDAALQIGEEAGIRIHSGVYLQTTGSQYETPAEIRAFRMLGADTVGMSSAVEAIAAVHMGMKVVTINCVTNMAAGITGEELSHSHVSENAQQAAGNFARLITGLLQRIKP